MERENIWSGKFSPNPKSSTMHLRVLEGYRLHKTYLIVWVFYSKQSTVVHGTQHIAHRLLSEACRVLMLHICIISQLCNVILTAKEKKTTRKREAAECSYCRPQQGTNTWWARESVCFMSSSFSFLPQTILKDQHSWSSALAVDTGLQLQMLKSPPGFLTSLTCETSLVN